MNEKTRENRLRREARRQGLALQKSRSRTIVHPDYGTYCLVDPYRNTLEYGDANTAYGYGMSLDEIEDYLKLEG